MIGWKIECKINNKSVIAEVVSQPWGASGSFGPSFMVYYDGHFHTVKFYAEDQIKVIERK